MSAAGEGAPSEGAPGARLDAITGLRFFAALHVVLFHYAPEPARRLGPVAERFVGAGFVGVSFFFVLSGFILAYSYANRPPDTGPRRRRFYAARFARIYPLYLAALLLALPGFVLRSGDAPLWLTAARAAAALGLVQAWHPWLTVAWNLPAWSLSVEAAFYGVFPRAFGWWRRRSTGQLLGAAAVAWGLLLVPPFVFYGVYGTAVPARASAAPWYTFVRCFPPFHLPQFGVGLAAGVLVARGALPPPRVCAALLAGAGALVVGALVSPWPLPFLVLNNGALAPLFAVVAVGLAGTSGWWTRLLSWPGLVLLGEASYGVYILQQPVHEVASGAAQALGRAVPDGHGGFVALFVSLLVLVSVALYYGLEVPARRRLRARFDAAAAAPRAGLS